MNEEPDYRFTLANERTLLAWIRTSLALTAGGLGVSQLLTDFAGRRVLSVALVVLGLAMALAAYPHWSGIDRAIRVNRPLPPSRLSMILAVGAVALTGRVIYYLLIAP